MGAAMLISDSSIWTSLGLDNHALRCPVLSCLHACSLMLLLTHSLTLTLTLTLPLPLLASFCQYLCCCMQDDMKLAVDFFPYFHMGAKMLDNDSSLYCVSSWNDHGQAQFVQNSSRLERSDFFPGLGWMLTNSLWQSLK